MQSKDMTSVPATKNGLCIEYHSNGKKFIETTYIDGKLNGLYRQWYDDGIQEIEKGGFPPKPPFYIKIIQQS